jgi:Tfp pilus assembly protein PilX
MKRIGSRKPSERGYVLMLVVVCVALVSITVGTVMQDVTVKFQIADAQGDAQQAKDIADSGLWEMSHARSTKEYVPEPDSATLTRTIPNPTDTDSAFVDAEREFEAETTLIRITPIADTSLLSTQAVVYELEVRSRYRNGESSSESRAELVQVVSWSNGRIVPRRHGR